MDKTIIAVENLRTYFHLTTGVVKAVDGVSFTLKKGETMGIVGESGSGKSVTAASIMRLLPKNTGRIESGSIEFEGRNLVTLPENAMCRIRGKEITMIFQDPMTSLDPVYKVGVQVKEVIRTHRSVDDATAHAEAVDALRKVGIPEPEKRMNAYPHEFSGGMRQRVMIAMAIICRPKLIIADEPTTALDVTVQAQVLQLLKSLQNEIGTSILLITHNLGVVWDVCDRVMVMYAGKTVEYTTVEKLYTSARHPYTWGLLDAMPKRQQSGREALVTIEGSPPDLRLTGTSCNFHNRCPYAEAVCYDKVPALVEVAPGHFVACHFQTAEQTLSRKQVRCDR